MTKSQKLMIALMAIAIIAVFIPVRAAEMCDECKKNPEKCKIAQGEECENPTCGHTPEKKEVKIEIRCDQDEEMPMMCMAKKMKCPKCGYEIECKMDMPMSGCKMGDMKMMMPGSEKQCPMMDVPDMPEHMTAPKPAAYGFIGIVTEEQDGKLVVKSAVPESPAEKAGIKSGDIILAINEVMVKTPDQLIDVLKSTKPGDMAHLKIVADGQEKMMHIKLAPRPGAMSQMPMKKMQFKMRRHHTKAGRGAGYFGPGMTIFKYGELNTRLANHGFDTINDRQFTFGGGGWGQSKRVRFGGFGMGGGKTMVNDTVSIELGYGVGFFEVGYSLINTKHFIFTPMLGIGGGGLGLKITAIRPPTSVDSLLNYPGGKSQLSYGGLAMYPGFAIDIPISVIGLSLKGGYIWSPINSGWQHEGFGVINGPKINLDGPFASLGIMFGGGK